MIINRIGAQYCYKGITYTVGDKIIANGESEYEGLLGTIIEIRDGDEKEKDNDIPDIYCSFMTPFDPSEIQKLEKRFSCLSRQEKKLEDIALDLVIMSPEMIRIMNPNNSTRKITVYVIQEEWINDNEGGYHLEYALDEEAARRFLVEMVNFEKEEHGCITQWAHNPRFRTVITPLYYECWLEDEYCSNHYKAYICSHELCMRQELFEAIGTQYNDMKLRNHFTEQIEGWEELEGLSDDEITNMIASPKVPQQIRKKLVENGNLIESFWESVAEAAFAIVKKYREGQL